MEVDQTDSNNILLSTDYQIHTYNIVERKLTSIAGKPGVPGLEDGAGDQAEFSWVTGFAQLDSSIVVVVDSYNNCLRQLESSSRRVSHYAGVCQFGGGGGNNDGVADQAQFDLPWSVYVNRHNDNELTVTDTINKALRLVSTINREVTTLMTNLPDGPYSIVWHPHDNSIIYVSCACVVIIIDLTSISRGYDTLVSYCTGASIESDLKDIMFLSDSAILLADSRYNQLYVYDINSNASYSICTGEEDSEDGGISQCKLNDPESLLQVDDQIYVGEDGSIRTLQRMYWLITTSISKYFALHISNNSQHIAPTLLIAQSPLRQIANSQCLQILSSIYTWLVGVSGALSMHWCTSPHV